MLNNTIFFTFSFILIFSAITNAQQDYVHEVLEDANRSTIDLDEVFVGLDNRLFRWYSITDNSNPDLFSQTTVRSRELLLDYEPDAYGKAVITVEARSLFGGTTEAFINVTVEAVNDPPSYSAEGIDPLPEDAGPQNFNNWALFEPGPNEDEQTAKYHVNNVSNPGLFSSPPSIDQSGNLTFTPAGNQFGSSTFEVFVKDNGGTANGGVDQSDTQIFEIEVLPVNDQPGFTASNPPAILEDAGPITIQNWATFNPGPQNESEQSPTYRITQVGDSDNLLAQDPSIDPSGALSYQFKENAYGSVSFKALVEDDGGASNGGVNRSVEKSFTLTAKPVNDAPVFDSDPVLTALEDAEYTYEIKVSDVETPQGQLTVAVKSKPDWLTYNGDQRILSGVPLNEHVGVHQVVLSVTDNNKTTDQEFKITVQNTNDPPQFVSNPPKKAIVGENYVYNIQTQDPDKGDRVELSLVKKPSWLTFEANDDGTGALSGSPTIDFLGGDNEVALKATDREGASTVQQFDIDIVRINRPPEFVSEPVTTASQGELYQYNIEVKENDIGDKVRIEAIDLPGWLSLSDHGDNTALLRGTPDNKDTGDNRIVLVATDEVGERDNQIFTIEVEDVNDPPFFESTPPTLATEDDEYIYQVVFADPDQGDELRIALAEGSNWLSLTETGDNEALLSGIPGDDDVGVHFVSLQVKDSEGLEAYQEFQLTVENVNDVPVFTSEPNYSAQTGEEYIYEITVDDPDPGAELTIQAHELPEWVSFSITGEKSARLQGSPDAEDETRYSVVLSVTDEAQTQSYQEFTIVINRLPTVKDIMAEIDEDNHLNFTDELFSSKFIDDDGHSMKSIRISSLPENGSLSLNDADVTENQAIESAYLDELVYLPDENYSGQDQFSWKASDGISYSEQPAKVIVTINPVNDPPVVTVDDEPVNFIPVKDEPKHIANSISITDPDNEQILGAQVFFNPSTFKAEEDRLLFEEAGNIQFVYSEEAGTLILTGADTKQTYEDAIGSILYDNIEENYTAGSRTITIYVDDGETSSNFVKRQINIVDGFVELDVPTGFTPNSDGDNDTWVIDQLEQYPDASIRVFDRTGLQVFSARGNEKVWDGNYNGKPLPVGPYFFVIELNPFKRAIKGSVTIIR